MTLKSKYFQADRLMSQHPLSIKSPNELRKVILKILKGNKVLFSLSIEQNIDIKKFSKELFGVLLKNCAVAQFINRLFRGWV
jgi:hypothetical protein